MDTDRLIIMSPWREFFLLKSGVSKSKKRSAISAAITGSVYKINDCEPLVEHKVVQMNNKI